MDASTLLGQSMSAQRNAADWKAYALQLEHALQASKAKAAGIEAVKDAALKELARVDPRNYLMVQQNRQRIFDASRNAALEGKRAA